MTGALDGIRVLESSHMIMGPSCAMALGDLGADLVKVEPAPGGDNTRRLAGEASGFLPAFNRNKRSIALDLKSTAGAAGQHWRCPPYATPPAAACRGAWGGGGARGRCPGK